MPTMTEQSQTCAATGQEARFTLDGDDGLERHLRHTCEGIVDGILGLIPSGHLQAVILGGGYGRGEGGVLRELAGDRPYNDLEFYVAIKGNRHLNELRYHRRLEVLGEILTHLADVEIEFKITSLEEIGAKPASMFAYDLAVGHRVLWAGRSVHLASAWDPHRDPEKIPQSEATRLLMNRSTGLLFARGLLETGPLTRSGADFVVRNCAKAQLAFGDALLAARGAYHWSCRERHRRLAALSKNSDSTWLRDVLRHHAAGIEFKLHPQLDPISKDLLFVRLGEVTAFAMQCWLRLESCRLGGTYSSARSYAEDGRNKCANSSPLLNLLLNFRADRFRLHARPRPWRHPRQRIYHAMSLLLWEPNATTDPVLQRQIRSELNLSAFHVGVWEPAYRALWGRVR